MAGIASIQDTDPDLWDIIKLEDHRQRSGLEMIASENFASRAVLEALGTCLTNKYAEGLPGKRYYGGTEFVDKVETICINRAIQVFGLDASQWGVNVQPYSGSVANIAAYTAVLAPGEKLIGLGLAAGGHLSHGFRTETKKVNASAVFWESSQYGLDKDGFVDYDAVETLAKDFQPKLIICGGSAYPRDWDYARLRQIANQVNALLLCDMAHYSGLVAGKVVKSPFEWCDLVTTTTHKTLRGPRAGMIFFRQEHAAAVNNAVFPCMQGGPHMNTIAAIATALKEASTPEFSDYAQRVVDNCRALSDGLIKRGYTLQTGGTDTHLILWDLRPQDITGSKMELLLETVNISVNKNAVAGDTKMMTPGGIRVGTAPLTTRGLQPNQCETIAEYFHRAVQIAASVQSQVGKQLADFRTAIENHDDVKALRRDVEQFASTLAMPGFTSYN